MGRDPVCWGVGRFLLYFVGFSDFVDFPAAGDSRGLASGISFKTG